MKTVIFSIFLFAFVISNAQSVNNVPLKNIKAEYIQIVVAIYGSKETAEKECSYRNEFLKAGIIKTDSK